MFLDDVQDPPGHTHWVLTAVAPRASQANNPRLRTQRDQPAALPDVQDGAATVSPRTWIKNTNYLELEFRPSFRSFARQRADLVAVLELLPRKARSVKATVTRAGKILERTMLSYAQWLALHERAHVKQIARIVNPMQ